MIGAAAFDRAAIENAIEALIGLLDSIDGDPDLEPEADLCTDDHGEEPARSWREPRPVFARPLARRIAA